MNKVIIARLSVKAGSVEVFKQHAGNMVEQTRKEPGCKVYTLYQEVDAPEDFIFYEEYVDEEAIQYHRDSAHFKQFGQLVGEMLTQRNVQVF